jgi:hypothetical protein
MLSAMAIAALRVLNLQMQLPQLLDSGVFARRWIFGGE